MVPCRTASPISFLCCVVGSASLFSATTTCWRLAIFYIKCKQVGNAYLIRHASTASLHAKLLRPCGNSVAPSGGEWCWEPLAGAGWTRPAVGKRRSRRHGRYGPSGASSAPPGQLSGAWTPGPGVDGCQDAAGRGGYVARARHRVATLGAATSGAARQLRSPSSVLMALVDLSRIVLSCFDWSVAWANSHSGNWVLATVSALFWTKGDDGGRHRRRRQCSRAFCLLPLAVSLPGSGDPIGGTLLGRQRWDTSLLGTVDTGLCYKQNTCLLCHPNGSLPTHCVRKPLFLTFRNLFLGLQQIPLVACSRPKSRGSAVFIGISSGARLSSVE